MIAPVPGLLASLFYLCATVVHCQALARNRDRRQLLLGLAGAGLLLHLWQSALAIHTEGGYDFSFFRIATLFSWVMVAIVLAGSLRKPLENLLLVILPIAILGILSSTFLGSSRAIASDLGAGVALHSILGIMAFSLITIAAVQALLVAWLSRELKQHHFRPALRHMPPLQTMEALLFSIIRSGFIVLLAVIISGFVFMEDMFAQHLVHKTGLTLFSCVVFGILLWGRHVKGWRGRKALWWILVGYAVLLLAYFGSKFVLELLLHRV